MTITDAPTTTAPPARWEQLELLITDTQRAFAALDDRLAARAAAVDQQLAEAHDTLAQLPDVDALTAELGRSIGRGDATEAQSISGTLAGTAPAVKAAQARIADLEGQRRATPKPRDRQCLNRLRILAALDRYIETCASVIAEAAPVRYMVDQVLAEDPSAGVDLQGPIGLAKALAEAGEAWGPDAAIWTVRENLDGAVADATAQAQRVIRDAAEG